MQFVSIDENGVYQGMAEGVEGDVAGSWLVPSGIKTSVLGIPPTDEPGQWREDRNEWKRVAVEEQIAAFTNAIQAHLDGFAQTRNYDGIMSAATYAASTVPKFRAEGQYAVAARDAVWATAYAILDEVLAGERPMPTIEEVIAELPALEWPEVETA